jgi:hypothetical protein
MVIPIAEITIVAANALKAALFLLIVIRSPRLRTGELTGRKSEVIDPATTLEGFRNGIVMR